VQYQFADQKHDLLSGVALRDVVTEFIAGAVASSTWMTQIVQSARHSSGFADVGAQSTRRQLSHGRGRSRSAAGLSENRFSVTRGTRSAHLNHAKLASK